MFEKHFLTSLGHTKPVVMLRDSVFVVILHVLLASHCGKVF
jgi:hypothetical protein